uniref:BTB domain-containing protein n=1 Tax=Tetradesmus obliquus TaxID=3088 RepID=A0A383WH79_TETOB|eukprot:jgi/Sobl393_1/2788/SZX76770.1
MEQLACLPGHRVILSTSEYFEAQGRHWQPQPQAGSSSSGGQAPASRPTLHLTIDSAEQLPAAEAVLAAMYGVEDAIEGLEQQQLVDAVVIADMLHAGTAAQ